jgi:hypothetical protein
MDAQPVPNAFAPPAAEPRPPRLLDRVGQACRVRHYSIRTENAYVDCIPRLGCGDGRLTRRWPAVVSRADSADVPGLMAFASARGYPD